MMNHPSTETDGTAITSQAAKQEPIPMKQQDSNMTKAPNEIEEKSPVYTALRSQFPFMWKICLCYGICYLLFSYKTMNGIGSGIFAAISAIFILMIAEHLKKQPVHEKELSIAISGESIFYFAAAVLISFSNCLTDSEFFLFFNHMGSFLLFSIACIKLFYRDKTWDFGKYTCILFSYWIQVLSVIPVPFQHWKSYQQGNHKKMSSTTRYILIGIAAGLPILMITTLLLSSADRIFSDLLESIFHFSFMDNWFDPKTMNDVILLTCGFVIYTLLLYLVISALYKGGLNEQVKKSTIFGTPIAVTIFIMIDIVYIVFSCIQFLFLFAGLPAKHEYADYARQGFFELLFVALINFLLILFCNKHFVRNNVLKAVMTITCLCTFVMIASSAYRMRLYIQAYHLTFLRVFVLWFLLLLSFFMAGSIISIYKEHWNSFRYCLFVLTCFYTVFALSDVYGMIAEYNVTRFEKDLVQSIQNPFGNVVPYLRDYLPRGYQDSKSYAAVLADLKENYTAELGIADTELIDDYFSVENFFFDYDFSGDYTLEPAACLYDQDIPASPFMWKHFNFVENTCYRKCKDFQNGYTVYGEFGK